MGHSVGKKEDIPGIEVHLLHPHGRARGLMIVNCHQSFAIDLQARMNFGRFVTARHKYGGAISRANIL